MLKKCLLNHIKSWEDMEMRTLKVMKQEKLLDFRTLEV